MAENREQPRQPSASHGDGRDVLIDCHVLSATDVKQPDQCLAAESCASAGCSAPGTQNTKDVENSDDVGMGAEALTSGSAETTEAKQSNQGKKLCSVCGDGAHGCNFNAVTCQSCKAFFRRTAPKTSEARCVMAGNCSLNVNTRRFCSACRLKKCYSAGMKRELILGAEEKAQRNAKVKENREQKQRELRELRLSVTARRGAGSGGEAAATVSHTALAANASGVMAREACASTGSHIRSSLATRLGTNDLPWGGGSSSTVPAARVTATPVQHRLEDSQRAITALLLMDFSASENLQRAIDCRRTLDANLALPAVSSAAPAVPTRSDEASKSLRWPGEAVVIYGVGTTAADLVSAEAPLSGATDLVSAEAPLSGATRALASRASAADAEAAAIPGGAVQVKSNESIDVTAVGGQAVSHNIDCSQTAGDAIAMAAAAAGRTVCVVHPFTDTDSRLLLSPMPIIRRQLTDSQQAEISALECIYAQSFRLTSGDEGASAMLQQCNHGFFVRRTRFVLRGLVQFASQLQGFAATPHITQVALLKSASPGCMLLRSAQLFDLVGDCWSDGQGTVFRLAELSSAFNDANVDFFRQQAALARSFEQLLPSSRRGRKDMALYALLQCIMVMSPEHAVSEGNEGRDVCADVSDAQQRYMMLLRQHLESVYSFCCASDLLPLLLQRLNLYKCYSPLARSVLSSCGIAQAEPPLSHFPE